MVAGVIIYITATAIGCSHNKFIPPPTASQIPSNYYECLEVFPDDLLREYFHINFGNVERANTNFKNIPILFKNVRIDEVMLRDRDSNIFYLSSIKCTPLIANEIPALKIGELIDVIGINRGPWLEYEGWLYFDECVFLPSGYFQTSAGGPTFAPGY